MSEPADGQEPGGVGDSGRAAPAAPAAGHFPEPSAGTSQAPPQASRPEPSAPPGPAGPSPAIASFGAALRALTPRGFVTEALVAANVLVFAVMVIRGVDVMEPKITDLLAWGAGYGPRTASGEPWRLFTQTFVHIGAFHLAMNMYALWGAGRLVERMLGNAGFLVAYLAAGLAGSVASMVWSPYVVSAGASGAVFGVYGALVGFLARERRSVPSEVLQSLGRNAAVFVGLNLMIGLKAKGIDMAAHVGGLAGGFVAGVVLAHPLDPAGASRRWLRTAIVAAATAVSLAAFVPALPKPVDIDAELEHVVLVEKRFNQAVDELKAGRMTERDFADEIETRVVPDYDAVRRRLLDTKGLPSRMRSFVTSRCAYMEAREDAYRRVAKAVRTGDAEEMKQAGAQQKEADRLLEALEK